MHVRSLGWEDPLEEELATPLQYFCLKNPMDKKKKIPWTELGATVHRVAKSDTPDRASKSSK